jgi:epoxyqueuosine reductase
VRNACIAAGNWGSQAALPALETLLQELSPLLRGHAAWALAWILGEQGHATLNALLRAEHEPQVRAELMALLDQAIRFD